MTGIVRLKYFGPARRLCRHESRESRCERSLEFGSADYVFEDRRISSLPSTRTVFFLLITRTLPPPRASVGRDESLRSFVRENDTSRTAFETPSGCLSSLREIVIALSRYG